MKSTTSATLLLVATFLLGGVTGGIAHYLYRNHVASAYSRQPARRINPGDIAQQMAKELQLDEQQTEELRAIFKNGRDRYRALSLQFRPQYESLRKETNDQIRQILRPEQAARYDAFLKEVNNRRRDRPPPQR
jgi:Spy/CpxP family protein refolding chaperone